MLGTGQVTDEIRRRPSGEDLRVFWILVFDESRDRFAKDLAVRAVGGDRATVPWVVRDPGVFNDANSVMTDVADMLEAARTEIEAIGDGAVGVDLVLLARRELNIADASSPVQLPDWWPVERVRGALVATTVQDLTWSTGVPLSDEVAALGDLSRLLYELDVVLVERLAQMSSTKRTIQSLNDRVFDGGLADCLETSEQKLKELSGNVSRYRPSTRPGRNDSIVARLWGHMNSCSSADLPNVARALAKALGVEGRGFGDLPLVGVLNRPTSPVADKGIESCMFLLVALRSACRMLTAGAHADEYPRFPVLALRALSLDIRKYLDRVVSIFGATNRVAERK